MEQPRPEIVIDDSRCARCGYLLRTLRADGLCPECGYPIEQSRLILEFREALVREETVMECRTRHHRIQHGLIAAACAAVAILWLAPLLIVPLRATLEAHDAFEIVLLAGILVPVLLLPAARGYHARVQHADFAIACRTLGEGSRSTVERHMDGRILRLEAAYRNRASGAVSLLIAMAGAALILLAWKPGAVMTVQATTLMIWISAGTLLAEIAWINRGRLDHARSICYHRRIESLPRTTARPVDGSLAAMRLPSWM